MLRLAQRLFRIIALLGFCLSASAFSLLGPFTSWMDELHYDWDGFTIGGPMNVGEEYRWNIPVITYGFDPAFVDYFGTNGVAEVEKAIQLLNDLPSVSAMNLETFPLNSSGTNTVAAAWHLVDLQSAALAALLEQLGLAQSDRHVWCLRDRWVTSGNTTNYLVIQRNFDPYIWQPSSYVNGSLYTYEVREFAIPFEPFFTLADAFEFPADPLASDAHVVSGTFLAPGRYFINLTRDDAGGLRYLLSAANVNAERLIPGVRGADANPANYVDAALRPGVEKLTFVRVSHDSLLEFSSPFTNRFADTYLSNGVPVQQTLERVVTKPDILFSARDLEPNLYHAPVLVERTGTSNWVNNAALIGSPGEAGPGVIVPRVTIAFNRLGRPLLNTVPFSLNEDTATPMAIWGSFDGTTNPPVVYPVGFVTPVPLTLSLKVQGSGAGRQLQWHLWGTANACYRFESSQNLVNWTLEAVFTNSTGVMTFTQPANAGTPYRFYRVRDY